MVSYLVGLGQGILFVLCLMALMFGVAWIFSTIEVKRAEKRRKRWEF